MNDIERLKRTLMENGESPEEAESLAQVGLVLQKLPVPEASRLQMNKTLALMNAMIPRPKSRLERFREWYPVAVMVSQVQVIHREIWLASALVLVVGVFVTLFTSNLFLYSALAPMVTAVGVALLYDHDIMRMLELEETTRMTKWALLLARLTLVFGFNLLLALTGSVVLVILRADFSLLPLVMSWLAPMTFLSGLTFFSSVLLVDALASSAISLLLWMVHLILKSQTLPNDLLRLLAMPGLSDPANRPFVMLVGILLVAVALWIVHENRHENA